MLTRRIGVDLGTRTTRVLVKGEGVVSEEPSAVAAVDGDRRRAPAGLAALQWAARAAPDPAAGPLVEWPIEGARIVDEAGLEALVRHATGQGGGPPRLFRPDVVIAIASDCSGDDRRRLLAVAARTGSRTAHLIDAPLAAALGADLPTDTATGALVVHAGTVATEIAVICHEGTVARTAHPVGGRQLDRLLAARVAELTGVAVSAADAELLKHELRAGPAAVGGRGLAVTGSEVDPGRPAPTATVTEAELWPALLPTLDQLAAGVTRLLEALPGRLAAAHRRHGAVLTGGTALLAGLGGWLQDRSGLPVTVAPDPERCCVLGTGRALDRLDSAGRQLLYMR